MSQITYPDNRTGSIQIVHGSDGRFDTSSRSDSRRYYNSRDLEQTYTVPFQDPDCDLGEFVVYLQNTSSDLILVVSSIGINSTISGTFILHEMDSATAAGAAVITPQNLNLHSSNSAAANARGGAGGVTTVATAGIIDVLQVATGGHEEFRLGDTLRLGQNQSIAVEYDRGASSIVEGVIFFFFE